MVRAGAFAFSSHRIGRTLLCPGTGTLRQIQMAFPGDGRTLMSWAPVPAKPAILLAFPALVWFLSDSVNSPNASQGHHRAGLASLSCVALVLWLWVLALATSPQLHSLLHSDAQSSNHVCLVSELHHHSLSTDFSHATAPTPLPLSVPETACVQSLPLSSCDNFLPHGRGPPAPLATSEVAS